MIKLDVYTNIAPHYRLPLWSRMLGLNDVNVDFYYSKNQKIGIKEIDLNDERLLDNLESLHVLNGIWIFDKILFWQKGVIKNCINNNFDVVIFLADMYCISSWLGSIICKVRGKEVVFWGHGLYGNEGFIKEKIRLLFYKLSNKLLVYERRSKKLLIEKGFEKDKIYVLFNSLDYNNHTKLREKYSNSNKENIFSFLNPELPTLIFIGRLTEQKKIDILIKAVNKINRSTVRVNLFIVGDGPEITKLKEISQNGIENNWIRFFGPSYNEEQNAIFLSAADLCVSPGNVGLTSIYSLTYGTPVATHDDMSNQMPEAEVINDGVNGFLFERDSVIDLSNKIIEWFSSVKNSTTLYENCISIIDKYYNPDYQVTVFKRLLNDQPPEI